MFSVRTTYLRVKHKRDIFFDVMAILTGLSMIAHFLGAIITAGNEPIGPSLLMAMRYGAMFSLFTLFGFSYRRMIVEG